MKALTFDPDAGSFQVSEIAVPTFGESDVLIKVAALEAVSLDGAKDALEEILTQRTVGKVVVKI